MKCSKCGNEMKSEPLAHAQLSEYRNDWGIPPGEAYGFICEPCQWWAVEAFSEMIDEGEM